MSKEIFKVGDHVEIRWGEYEGHCGIIDGDQGVVVNANSQASLEWMFPTKDHHTDGGFYLQAHQIRLLKTPANHTPEGLTEMARQCDVAETEVLEKLKEAIRIADNMRDVWKHQRCGAE